MINKKYTATKKNNGNIPLIKDTRTRYVPIGCGKCIECLKQKSNSWKIRLHEEYKSQSIQGQFVTLTFSKESIKELSTKFELKEGHQNNELATKAVRYFLENYRKSNKKSARHWLVTELGHKNTERIHLHGIIWASKEEILKHWKYGWVYIGDYVNEATINYIIKYITKIDIQHIWFKPKVLCSPGIGSNYTNTFNSQLKKFDNENTDESYNYNNGKKGALPTYYRNKIYTEEQREQLWINRLNKEERWVCGERISTKDNLDNYYKLRDWHRSRNQQMKYGHKLDKFQLYNENLKEIRKLSKENINIAKQSHTNQRNLNITPDNQSINSGDTLTQNTNFQNETFGLI